MFPDGPEIARDRDVFLLAFLVVLWDEGPWQGERAELLDMVRAGLRRLLEAPETALAAVRADRVPGSPHEALAAEIVKAAEEIAVRAPWLWLETLFIIESALAGPQWFETAFEGNVIPLDTMP